MKEDRLFFSITDVEFRELFSMQFDDRSSIRQRKIFLHNHQFAKLTLDEREKKFSRFSSINGYFFQ